MRISSLLLNLVNCSSNWCGEHCSTQLESCLIQCNADQDCIRDCNRDFPKCETDCDSNQFLILGRTDFPSYEANGVTDDIVELKHFNYHHHEVDMACSIEFQDKFWIIGGFYNENS